MTPLEATGIRIIVSSGMIAIDEIEVNAGEPPIEESQLAIGVENGDLVISWTGDGILESSDSIDPNAQWSTVPDQSNPYRVPAGAAISGSRFYRTKSE
jgi:hypothetical protein